MNLRTEAPYIVLMEDDHFAREDAEEDIKRTLRGARIEDIETEHQFRTRMPSFQEDPPDLFILDIRVRWTDPSPNSVPAPQEVISGSYREAGFRCLRLLTGDPRLASVPVVLWSIMAENEIDPSKIVGKNTTIVSKGDGYSSQLAVTTRRLLTKTD